MKKFVKKVDKNLVKKILGKKKLGKKCWVEKKIGKKILGEKNLGGKKFWGKKFEGNIFFWGGEFVWPWPWPSRSPGYARSILLSKPRVLTIISTFNLGWPWPWPQGHFRFDRKCFYPTRHGRYTLRIFHLRNAKPSNKDTYAQCWSHVTSENYSKSSRCGVL